MRTRARVDANHREIVDGLRQVGYSVLDLSQVGKGCPDILVGGNCVNPSHRFGVTISNVLFEIKSDKGDVNDDQQKFIDGWRGPVFVVRSLDEARRILQGEGEMQVDE